MKIIARRTPLALLLALSLPAPLHAARKPPRKSPHTQIVAVCRVETAPAEIRGENASALKKAA